MRLPKMGFWGKNFLGKKLGEETRKKGKSLNLVFSFLFQILENFWNKKLKKKKKSQPPKERGVCSFFPTKKVPNPRIPTQKPSKKKNFSPPFFCIFFFLVFSCFWGRPLFL
ncbi:hypothetical protein PLAN_MP10024 (plasmid) [Planktothrix rubescens CCAP 1459/22]|uniref:Uncharacterized protein n=1 Tax=Planktothrix rubescens CCAP 1459/22 TaxID=329571 RepID=A0A6J7ZEA2_PLARU|nr:hypothetical protein PLAN_MP10024 [Planktothrix rubescens NIVA-CYA 18]